MSTAPVQAPQQSLGYSIQECRMLYHLLTVNLKDQVAYEVYDDVTVIREDGAFLVEQITSSQSSNPLSDGSTKPWKTFSNWIDSTKAKIIDPEKSEFVLYVLQEYTVGKILKQFHEADTLDKAKVALNVAKEYFWGKPPGYPKRSQVPKSKKDYLENILNADEKMVLHIIKNFRVVTGDSDPETELKHAIANTHFSLNVHDDVLTKLYGWLKRKKDSHLAEEKRFVVTREEILIFLNQIQKQYDSTVSLDYVIEEPNEIAITGQVNNSPLYIKQLEIIELEDIDKIRAAKDFLKSSAFRTRMAKSGEYSERHFEEFTSDLLRAWDSAKMASESPGITDELYGRKLYGRCMERQDISILGIKLPWYFIAGSFHHLANASLEQLQVGWHRNFKSVLAALKGIAD